MVGVASLTSYIVHAQEEVSDDTLEARARGTRTRARFLVVPSHGKFFMRGAGSRLARLGF